MQNRLKFAYLSVFLFGSVLAYGNVLVENARKQIGVTVSYDPQYSKIDFPMGDVPATTGVCTDVVIRAYRLQGLDLQQAVNKDMKSAWEKYPKLWGLKNTDTNIDHRRVPNLETFFSRYGKTLSLTDINSFQAGDIVTWRLPKNLPHIGLVSDKKSADGTPLIIHNIGRGTVEEDILFKYKIVGHYRLPENIKFK
ncbi:MULTISPECIES: DUF1287 domain-containing protein [Mannheimia]|uniref:DUF1287 domain-containing protein n=1 Tax=Mannheimia pernigra TaxID=111844 RepID=A0A7H8UW09_9PAST|nr:MULTISPECIES: DUF1287 domain-containing protein [Mannheimia]QLB40927.1 DUF1287 domain-containing protein [Mannheimia pernigra]QLB42865.1 DUF1287 domain-containing protein [Mannheimia pernigra]QLB44929.1 DUF1287 domain-containing protein [Mannheimia pernigra]QTM01719.1 DUF1287 domain-containing protein [Mannheimia sp. ZY171111]